jgi:hypothetical protein
VDTEEEWARLLSALGQQHDRDDRLDRRQLLQRGLALACTVGSDAVGCSVSEAVDGGFQTPVSSNSLALELDLAQYAAGDGPCVAACRDAQPHSISVMATQQRFPDFAAAARQHGVGSSLSLPLRGVRRPSALNLYAGTSAAFDAARTRARAELLARCIAALLPQAQPLPEQRPADSRGGRVSERRRLVQRAVSQSSTERGLEPAEAFGVLARRSRDEQRSIFEVARDVIGGSDR